MAKRLARILESRKEEAGTSITLTTLATILALANLILLTAILFKIPVSWVLVLTFSFFMIVQATITIIWMLYAWNDPKTLSKNRSPKVLLPPQLTFTAIIPARHEEEVIADTLNAVASIDYPKKLHEVLVVCRADDTKTINEVKRTILERNLTNTRLIIFHDTPINKPHGLNVGLAEARGKVVVVFDAEDEPHKDIYSIVNTVMVKEQVAAVQSGVQLMNYHSSWYSSLNVLEYFFWFRSTLHFFSKTDFIPLAGNTVFVKKAWLKAIGGWDENCLTEDADLGIRLSAKGAKIRVIYDEKHVTREETPPTIESFVKQRTRWNQGFMQIFAKGEWLKLPRLTQRILAAYLLLLPEIQSVLFLYLPVSLIMVVTYKLPVWIAMISAIPMYLFALQLLIYNIGLYEFTKAYKLPYPWWSGARVLLFFYPYQIFLCFSAIRAVVRSITNNLTWEKTEHINAHRKVKPALPIFVQMEKA
jgi:glycosyltransferase XagB